MWGKPVRVSFEQILKAYSLITGGTGSGKTRFALGILKSVINRLPENPSGFGVIDPKGDLYAGTLFLLAERLNQLGKTNPATAKELRHRIFICDFGSGNPVTSYNLLRRPADVEADFFISNRAEMLLDLLAGSDKLSLGGTAVLQKILRLLSELNMPLTYLEEVLTDADLLERLVSESTDVLQKTYFARQFPEVPKVTVAALHRRVAALFASTSVRLALSSETAPDFRRLMDDGSIVLVNCFGQSISRDVRRVLQSLVLTDIRQAVFARKSPEKTFTWFADEAQNFFISDNLRDSMADLLTMSRSFGSFFCFLTQNMSTAVQDARMLSTLYTNIRWSFSMRGEPSDSAFLKSALPVTGRRARPRRDPFAEQTFCSPAEERGLLLDEIANLPDRTGWLWLRTETPEAIPMHTPDVSLPSGQELEGTVAPLKRDPTVGGRTSRKAYDRLIAERDKKWKQATDTAVAGGVNQTFVAAYRRMRGKEQNGDA